MDRWIDLGLNLVAEALGIIATVFWIDRLIKKREEARWKPSKYLVYSRLLQVTWNILTAFLPDSFNKKAGYSIYEYGEIGTLPAVDMSSEDLSDEKLHPLLYEELGSHPIRNFLEKREEMKDAQKEINAIISDSAFFLEPEVLSLLLRLKGESNDFLTTLSNINESAADGYFSEDLLPILVYSISAFLASAQKVESWLIKQSTRKLTYEEWKQEFLGKQTAANNGKKRTSS